MSASEKKPKLFLYSLLVPIIWVSFGVLMDFLMPGKRLGTFGLLIVIYLAITPIFWHFSKTYRRHLLLTEKVRLIIYCTFWASIAESLGLWYFVNFEATDAVKSLNIPVIIGITIAIDALFFAAAIHFTGNRMINYFLKLAAEKNT